jgi:hypothetical protein
VSKDVIIPLTIDDSDMNAKVAAQQSAIDTQAEDWRRKRNEILLQMHSINLGIGLMVQTVRMAVRATGQTLDPIQSALLSMVSSTSSLIIATATAMAAGSLGLLAGAALALAAFAWGFQLAQTAKIQADMEKFKGDFAAANARLARIEGVTRQAIGRAF